MNYRRAVSDLVAFTLVFTTIVFLIGGITITGITTLGDVQAGTETNIAEETMRSLAGTISDHRTDSAPSRSTTIKLQGHSLRLRTSTLGVNVSSGSSDTNLSLSTNALVRQTETDTLLVYESGGVFRIEEEGGDAITVAREPPIRCGTNSAHLPFTLVRGDPNLTSQSRVTVETRLLEQELRYPANTSQTVSADSVVINTSQTAYPQGWETMLEDTSWEQDGNEYECDVNRVVVHQTVVNVQVVT